MALEVAVTVAVELEVTVKVAVALEVSMTGAVAFVVTAAVASRVNSSNTNSSSCGATVVAL